jgi:dihydroxyacetone kinase-like protein
VNRASRTMAFAVSGCTHPGELVPSFMLPEGELELGVGIHGERGRSRYPVPTVSDLAARVTSPLVQSLELCRGAAVIAIVNNLGATPVNELYVLYREVHRLLEASGVSIVRRLVGTFVTALDMRGCSLTLTVADDELVRLWDAPVNTPSLQW